LNAPLSGQIKPLAQLMLTDKKNLKTTFSHPGVEILQTKEIKNAKLAQLYFS